MKNESHSNEQDRQQTGKSQPHAVDAVRHVGPTLESEEAQTYVPARENASNEELAADAGLHIHTVSQPDGGDRAVEREQSDAAEPLRTHLAGDTSSDPHTDVDRS
jgi:hypothetical protein